MKRDEIFEKIVQILEEDFGIDPNDVKPSTLLNWECGIEGDDAVDFIAAVERVIGYKIPLDAGVFFAGESLFAKKRKPFPISILLDVIENSQGQ